MSSAARLDPFGLSRFLDAQAGTYQNALAELVAGQKESHWMWYVFPQIQGLGRSGMAQRYAITSVAEAKAYLDHPVLGRRLIECADAVLAVTGRSARDIFGSPDDVKLRSSATLFAAVSPAGSVFQQILDKYFDGQADQMTMALMG